MKNIFKSLFRRFIKPIDFILSVLVVPSAYVLLLYRRLGSARLSVTTRRLKRIGVFPLRNHYYEPLFDDRLISHPLSNDRSLPGINFNEQAQLSLLECLDFRQELIDLKLTEKHNLVESFCFNNGSFESGDAEFLYQLVRHLKPKKIIEIGSGNSTKIARLAIEKNRLETGWSARHICIEPYEQPWLEGLSGIEVIRERVEECKFDWKNELGPGDLLFVDSSHVIRPQGDVLKEYLEIFPSLAAGVYVHIHDIFTPKDYLANWIVKDVLFWNEQYLLEALLSHTDRYEIVAALNYLKHKHYERLKSVCPYLTLDREPGSFYFKVKVGSSQF